MSIAKSIDSHVSQADWDRMAKTAGIPADELKAKVVAALEDPQALLREAEVSLPTISDAKKTGSDCETQSFEVSLFKIVGLSGDLTLCGTSSSNWSAELKACLIVAGSKVWCTTYKFDPHNLSICYSPSVGVAKADLCFKIQIRGNRACLNISGKACVWGFGWRCGDFDTTVFCLPLP